MAALVHLKSVRAKVTVAVTAATAIGMMAVMVIAGIAMNSIMEDAASNALAHDVDEAVEEALDGDFGDAIENADSSMIQIVSPEGEVLAATARMRDVAALDHIADRSADGFEIDDLHEYGIDRNPWLQEDAPFLVTERQIDTVRGNVTLVGVTSLSAASDTARKTVELLAVVFLVALVLVAVLAWHLAIRTLRPVERMRGQVDSISADNLAERIPVPDEDPDLGPLATTFNEMLGRVEQSMKDQQYFMSGASHELKSPIAATRIMLDLLREHPESADLETTLADMAEENDRMAHIVEDMLALARHDEGRMYVEKTPIDLYDLVVEQVHAVQGATGVDVDVTGVEPLVVDADGELLGHVLRNLLDNAARYAKGRVAVAAEDLPGMVRIRVSDDGPGIPEADRERVFGRFVRLEDSRTRRAGSTGLGLAVVRSIVELHGGAVCFDGSELGGATAVVELPASEA